MKSVLGDVQVIVEKVQVSVEKVQLKFNSGVHFAKRVRKASLGEVQVTVEAGHFGEGAAHFQLKFKGGVRFAKTVRKAASYILLNLCTQSIGVTMGTQFPGKCLCAPFLPPPRQNKKLHFRIVHPSPSPV